MRLLGLSELVLGCLTLLPRFPCVNTQSTSSSIDCLDRPSVRTIEDLVDCFNSYTVPKHSYNLTSYTAAQPSTFARLAWNHLIASVLAVDDNCTSIGIPPSLQHIYQVTLFAEQTEGARLYCVLSEVSHIGSEYVHGWGLMIVPASRAAVSRFIHISAPHPVADINTPQQAASVFRNTGAKSLLVAGRHREAYVADSCVGPQYRKTDATHDTSELFFDAMKGIRHWQETKAGGCPSPSCAYIQLHGKATCPTDTTFLSSGLRRDKCSDHWYSTVDSPVRRIRNELNIFFPAWNNSIPPDSSCNLLAANNVLGRLVNGVPESSVCDSYASCDSVTGQFVHIEQSLVSRDPLLFGYWSMLISRAFVTSCITPLRMDETTLLCSYPRSMLQAEAIYYMYGHGPGFDNKYLERQSGV